MKCNQWVFCLDISGYSTLKNPRQSKEFHSLVFYLAICANSWSQILQNRRHPMKCNQWGFCLGISGYSTLQNCRQSKEFHSLVFYLAICPNSRSQILQNCRHPMKCNQWGFCLGISGYSTLQNRRQSKEFHSLVFYLASHPNSSSQILQNNRHLMKYNQFGFCLGIGSYSTLQNCRQSEEWLKFFGLSWVFQCWVTTNS